MATYYASPSGLSSNSGTIGSPWDLQTALSNGSQTAGDTLYLRDGTYYGKYSSSLTGGTVRSYPGEWAVIDGNASTTLTAGINSSQTTFSVADGLNIYNGSNNEVWIDNEIITVYSKSGNNITNCQRNAEGSTGGAAAHSNGATVKLIGMKQLDITGSNTTYFNFEVRHSYPFRGEAGNPYRDKFRGIGVNITGSGNSCINLIIHDNLASIFTGSSSGNTLIYGCLGYNTGLAYDAYYGYRSGPNLYLENATGYSRVYETIMLNNFRNNAQYYGVSGAYVGGDTQGSVFAGGGNLIEGDTGPNLIYGTGAVPSASGTVNASHFIHTQNAVYGSFVIGYSSGVDNAIVTNNYFLGSATALEVDNVDTAIVTGNTFYTTGGNRNVLASEGLGGTWNNNTYYGTASGNHKFGNDTIVASQVFADWKTSTGYDASSTINSGAMPDTVIVRPNVYEIGRANIIVYAASNPASINVDLATTGLTDNQEYEIRNAYDFFGTVVATGVYDAGSTTIALPLNGAALNVATPIGHSYTPPTMLPDFGVFIVVPGAADASAPGTPTGLSAALRQTDSTTGSFLVSWTLGAGTETSVTLRRIVGGVTTDIPLAADTTSYTDTGQTVGLSYTYAVKASNAAGDSAWSDTVQKVLTGLTCFGAPPSIG